VQAAGPVQEAFLGRAAERGAVSVEGAEVGVPGVEVRVEVDDRHRAGSGDEPYSVPADVEFVFVLAGQLQVTVAGEQITLEQGDAFTFPASTQHTFRVAPPAGRAQVLWVFLPALPNTGPDVMPSDVVTARGATAVRASGAADG
jgi:cupin domain